MKKYFSLLVVAVMSICTFAQDIIVTKDSKKIDAKILEVSKNEIKYKEKDYLDGPTFVLETKEISSIIYANGKVVLYDQRPAQPKVKEKDPGAIPLQMRKEEEELARKQARIADSIAEANRQAKKKAENLIGGFTFDETEESGSGRASGKGSADMNRWSLAGRGLVGTLPKPSYDFNEEGTVVVQIRVNAAGNVVETKHKGGTVSDARTIQLALDAAKKAKFTKGDSDQIGIITYSFKFN